MTNLSILLIFTVISEALAVLFFFNPTIIGSVPYGTFTFLFAVLICFWVAYRLGHTRSETTDSSFAVLVDTLKSYFIIMGVFFFLDGIAHVGIPTFYPKDFVASHMHTFAHAFFFVGNAIIIRIPLSFINSSWKNIGSLVMGVFGVAAVVWRFINLDKLVYAFGPSIPPIIVVDKVSGIIILVSNILGLLLPGLYLMYRAIRTTEHTARVRALLLGLGMAIFFSIGPVIDLTQNQYTQLLIHLLQATSFCLMAASAFYGTKQAVVLNPASTSSHL